MPQITARLIHGTPIVDVLVSMSGPDMKRLTAAGQPIPDPQRVRALIDTGASHSCVTPATIERLSLDAMGSTQMFTTSTGTTPLILSTFAVGIIVPNGKVQALLIPSLEVTATQLPETQGIHVILGRDVLTRCILTYNGPADTITLEY